MKEEQGQPQDKKPIPENLWDTTLRTIQNVTHQATCYTKLAQKRIDLVSLQKKITNSHTDLGKLVDEARSSDVTNILDNAGVKAALQSLDSLKQKEQALKEEIESLKKEITNEPTERSGPTIQ